MLGEHHANLATTTATTTTMTDSPLSHIILRVCAHLPHHTPRPDRVRVVVKQQGECWFSFRRKMVTVRLQRASWRQVSEHLCVNESQQVAWMDVPALLVRAGRQQLDLKLYCLRGRTVQHKTIGSFQNLMQHVNQGELELALNLHYAGCAALKTSSQAVHEADVQHVHQHDAAHHVHGDETVTDGDVHGNEVVTHQDLTACEAHTVTDTEGTVCVVHDEAAVPVVRVGGGTKHQAGDGHVLEAEACE